MKIYKTLTDGTQIVEYEDSLAEAVAEMWNKSGEGWGGSFDNGIYTAERVRSKRAGGMFFNVYIAMKDGQALGYCSFNRYYKDADTAYVHLLNVRPDYHGKGLGKELVLMCVNETIARGMPRLDIHTWPGNTKAVPMYKKCGYFWEDRADTTHLCNFIPTVLSTELIKDFFVSADWYSDSTRVIEIKPDGKKVDKFELYEYSWEKNGKMLRVGFEKTGRRINLIETNDYLIEMTAPNHDLAYGLSYPCKFNVKNKTGKELDVLITAKNNDVISFDGSWSEVVTGETTFEGKFFVGEINEPQDDMRMHPCILAHVKINGKTAEFGLGIEPKFPVAVSLGRKLHPVKPGMKEDIYVNIKNGLTSDATVCFLLPQNPLIKFDVYDLTANLKNGKDSSILVPAEITECGYIGTPLTCNITMENGDVITMTRPLHIVNQGVTGQFHFEIDEWHCAANGLWRLKLNKQNNELWYDRIVPSGFVNFHVSKFGTPYDDEFNILKPSDIRVANEENFIRFEADYESGKFPGAVLTECYLFDSAGTIKRSHKVTNKGTTELDLSLMTSLWSNVGRRAVFPYDGGIHEVADKMNYGFDTIDFNKLDENWVFDGSGTSPSGIYWPPEYKPDVNWGDLIKFELQIGKLLPGQSFESKQLVYMCDLFKNFNEFRNYVLGISEDKIPLTHNHIEAVTNDGNPVLSGNLLKLTLRNNRTNIHDGTVSVSSPDNIFKREEQSNPKDELCTDNSFNITLSPGHSGIQLVDYSMKLSGYDFSIRRALMVKSDTAIKSLEKDNVYTIENETISFKVSPEHADTAFSLKYGENEWFYSNYPSLDPYAWWNPFVGGLKTNLKRMGNSLVLREKITAEFTTQTDNFANVWSGIRSDVYVESFEEYKGIHYTQYYLTLPGVPVMCHFAKVHNGTGRYIEAEPYAMIMLAGKEYLSELCAELTEGDIKCKVRPGSIDDEKLYDRLVTISREGENPHPEKLYVYKDSKRDNGKSCIGLDDSIVYCDFNMKKHIPDGKCYTTMPIFCILSEKDLKQDDLEDFRQISF